MKYFLFVIVTLLHASVFSQRSFYKSFSTAEGLVQSQVNSICQDSSGYLWIGTLGGVSRYNGHAFTNYSTDNGLLNNRINTIKWLHGKIFVGHQGGISIIDGKNITNYSLTNDQNRINVTDIIEFNGQIILSTNGEGLFKFVNKKITPLPLLKNDFLFVRDLIVWQNELYCATRGGVIRTSDLKSTENFIPNNDISISSLAIWNNKLLIASFYNGLQYYDRALNKITRTRFESSGNLFNEIYVDSRNYIWISTSNGILKFNDKEYTLIDNSTGLPFNIISTTFEDADHNMWLGSQGKGLIKASQVNISYYDQTNGLPTDIILSGFQTKEGVFYFGTMDKGVVKTVDFKTYTNIKIDPTVWCAIADIDGYHWFGTKYGLYAVGKDDAFKRFDVNDGAPGFKITSFLKINSKSMYVGGSHGIAKYNQGTFTPIGLNGDQIGTIRTIIQFNNRLIVGTDNGLFRLNTANSFELIGQLNRTVFSIAKTTSNRLFLGTEEGLYELTEKEEIKRIRYSQDVASNYINFIDNNDNELLIGTNNGLYFIQMHSNRNHQVKRVSGSDGLINPETNINSSFIDANKTLWFGTASALVKIDLHHFDRIVEKANLRFDHALLNFETFSYQEYKAKMIDGIPQNMSFPYNKKNLQFNFDGVALNNYDDLLFQYKLEGQDDKWMPTTKTPSITLRGLPAGNYVLHARILLEDGTQIDNVKIVFTIREAFFQTWWFYGIIAFAITGLVFLWFRIRIRREQAINELERAEFRARLITLEQQSLNASMNRHFIFNSLNSIQYFINISDKLSANKYLTSFAKLIRKNLDSSTEENGLVTLAEEIDRIRLYLSLEHMRFQGKFEYKIESENVDLESFLIPAMMIQPFVENSIIHGVLPQIDRMGKIDIIIKEIDAYLSIKIIDNGIGIERSIAQKNQHTGDHRSQGMEITMKRIDLIEKISGREMEIIGPQQTKDKYDNISGTLVEIKIMLNNLDNSY